ncbi:MAG: hypothetical protein JNJ46_05375 [Myxococcales bacterium]|nr:hypothetical protein [Myxococcales bacterium]
MQRAFLRTSLSALFASLVLFGAGSAHAQVATCGTPAAEIRKAWSKSDSFGDEDFGAAYAVKASLVGKRDGLEVAGDLTADANLFGDTKNIVKADASAKAAVLGASVSENVDVFVLGKNIFHHSRSTGTSSGSGVKLNFAKSWDVSFFSASKRFWVGPIPVKVKANAAGSAGITFDSDLGILAVDATLRPSAKAFVTATAGVDAWVAEAGVEGRLTLIEASVPTVGSLHLTTAPGVQYKLDSDLALNYLSGRLNVFAKALGKKYERKIADWSGTTRTFALGHESGCIKFL